MAPSTRTRTGFFARRAVGEDAPSPQEGGYRRTLGPWSLSAIGVGAIIGTGIFVLLGQVARDIAGPAVVISILIGGVVSALVAFVMAEFATIVPKSGGPYDYAYAALGRLPAFLMGWLVLNSYAVGNMTVAIGFSEFFASGLAALGFDLPGALASPPPTGLINLPAFLIMLLVTFITLRATRESTRVNNVLVGVKIFVVLLILSLGVFLVDPRNWTPFSPGGASGIITGAAILLFAYLGFDTVSTAAQEARRPRRDVPIGIVVSVGVSALLYLGMGAVLTGLQRAETLEARAPVAEAFRAQGYAWAAGIIILGAMAAMTTVLFAFHFGLGRILRAMARDGFLPEAAAKLDPKTGIPARVTLWSGVLTAVGAAFLPLRAVADMTVESAIFMYVLVSVGVLVLKRLEPDLVRPFRVHWIVPAAAIVLLLGLSFLGLGTLIHLVFLAWIGLGLALYGFYGHRRAERLSGQAPAR